MATIYGPDRNRALNLSLTQEVTIPTGVKLKFVFPRSDAEWENAVIVNKKRGGEILVEAGNYSRSRADKTIGPFPEVTKVQISGWHKVGPPNGALSWIQSVPQVFTTPDANLNGMGLIGYEDGADQDYNDIQVGWMFV